MRSIVSLLSSLFNPKNKKNRVNNFNTKKNSFNDSTNAQYLGVLKDPLTEAQEFFRDQENNPFDYSHLSERQAKRLLHKLKKETGNIDQSTYSGLMDVMHKDQQQLLNSELSALNDEDLKKWHLRQKKSGHWISTPVLKYISIRLKPVHEKYLLDKIENIAKNQVMGWVDARKKDGYFFSDQVYKKGLDIYLNGR
jgi:hypothetical protein